MIDHAKNMHVENGKLSARIRELEAELHQAEETIRILMEALTDALPENPETLAATINALGARAILRETGMAVEEKRCEICQHFDPLKWTLVRGYCVADPKNHVIRDATDSCEKFEQRFLHREAGE